MVFRLIATRSCLDSLCEKLVYFWLPPTVKDHVYMEVNQSTFFKYISFFGLPPTKSLHFAPN